MKGSRSFCRALPIAVFLATFAVSGRLFAGPLHEAAMKGDVKAAKVALESGADINEREGHGFTALDFASFHGHDLVVAVLLAAKGIQKEPANPGGWTPLHHAATRHARATGRGHARVITLLLGAGVRPDPRTKEGWTPLMRACVQGHPDLAALLIKGDADVNARDGEQKTPLLHAVWEGEAEVVRFLLGVRGVDLNAKAGSMNALDMATVKAQFDRARAEDYAEIARLLRARGLRPTMDNPNIIDAR